MMYSKENILDMILRLCRKGMSEKQFGEFGFTVTMHEGQPIKITEINTLNVRRCSGGLLQISK